MKTLDRNNSLLVIIDVQERLVNALEKDAVVQKTSIIAQAANILGIPTIVTEQYPKGLGGTVTAVKQTLDPAVQIVEKSAFSAAKENEFMELLKSHNKNQVVICGIETHICVHQTAAELLTQGYEVHVAKDACASRNKYEFKQGIERMKDNGAKISCVEIILFEWLESSKNSNFKEIQSLIK